MSSPVLAVETSDNAKLGCCSATYVSQASCPACVFKGNGCYAEYGRVGILTTRVSTSRLATPVQLALAEAKAIDGLTGDRPLRLHVVGDCRTAPAARIVAAASARYMARGGRPVWTYTHAWRAVARKNWDAVSVLALCESPDQVVDAMALGYAASLVVDRFPTEQSYLLQGIRVIPCPWQTRRITCRDCRLCWDDRRLLERGLVIGFEAHGSGAARVRRSLPVIEEPRTEEIAA